MLSQESNNQEKILKNICINSENFTNIEFLKAIAYNYNWHMQ